MMHARCARPSHKNVSALLQTNGTIATDGIYSLQANNLPLPLMPIKGEGERPRRGEVTLKP
jgi:hypothetical protein